MTVYHGATYWNLHNLVSGTSHNAHGLYVTDTPERAQLYADAQATQIVESHVRRAPGSAVVELETTEPISWSRRSDTHPTLDKCETTIKTWTIKHATIYIAQYTVDHGVMKINDKYVPVIPFLTELLRDQLTVVITD